MKIFFQVLFALSILFLSCKGKKTDAILNYESMNNENSLSFEMRYHYVGLGSNMGKKFPVFKVKDDDFIYTLEKNSSWNDEYKKMTDTICIGSFRKASADSIGQIMDMISDTLIYETNKSMIMSGGLDEFLIKKGSKKLKITLHNTSNRTAQNIINIVNSNIPSQYRKINLWDDNLGKGTYTKINWPDLEEIKSISNKNRNTKSTHLRNNKSN